MSDSQDAKAHKRAKAAALAAAVPGEDGLYDFNTFRDAFDYGDNFQIPTGARFKDPGSVDAWVNGGFGFGGIYDNSPISAVEYMQQTGMTPRQFAESFKSVPFRWNEDGTVSYDPSAAINRYEYRPASYDKVARNAALAGGALLGGASLANYFGAGSGLGAGLNGASLGAEELFAGMNSLVPGGAGVTEAIAGGAGTALLDGASLGAEELFSGMNSLVPGGAGVTEAIAGGAGTPLLDGASLGAEELFAGQNSLVPGGAGVAEATAAGAGEALTGAAGTGIVEAAAPESLAGLDAVNSFDSGAMQAILDGGDVGNSLGINSLNSFDTGEMSNILSSGNSTTNFTSGLPGGGSLGDGTQAPAPVVNRDPGFIDRSGFGKFLDQSTLDKLLKYGPLALGPLGLIQQKNAIDKASEKLGSLGSATRGVGESIVNQFMNGTLNPADLAGIDKWERDSIAASRQFFARAGTSRSTQAMQSEADIKKKSEEMRSQARQNLLKTGIDALGVTDKYQAAAIQAEMQGDQQMAQYAANFLNSYGSWLRALPTLTGQTATK